VKAISLVIHKYILVQFLPMSVASMHICTYIVIDRYQPANNVQI